MRIVGQFQEANELIGSDLGNAFSSGNKCAALAKQFTISVGTVVLGNAVASRFGPVGFLVAPPIVGALIGLGITAMEAIQGGATRKSLSENVMLGIQVGIHTGLTLSLMGRFGVSGPIGGFAVGAAVSTLMQVVPALWRGETLSAMSVAHTALFGGMGTSTGIRINQVCGQVFKTIGKRMAVELSASLCVDSGYTWAEFVCRNMAGEQQENFAHILVLNAGTGVLTGALAPHTLAATAGMATTRDITQSNPKQTNHQDKGRSAPMPELGAWWGWVTAPVAWWGLGSGGERWAKLREPIFPESDPMPNLALATTMAMARTRPRSYVARIDKLEKTVRSSNACSPQTYHRTITDIERLAVSSRDPDTIMRSLEILSEIFVNTGAGRPAAEPNRFGLISLLLLSSDPHQHCAGAIVKVIKDTQEILEPRHFDINVLRHDAHTGRLFAVTGDCMVNTLRDITVNHPTLRDSTMSLLQTASRTQSLSIGKTIEMTGVLREHGLLNSMWFTSLLSGTVAKPPKNEFLSDAQRIASLAADIALLDPQWRPVVLEKIHAIFGRTGYDHAALASGLSDILVTEPERAMTVLHNKARSLQNADSEAFEATVCLWKELMMRDPDIIELVPLLDAATATDTTRKNLILNNLLYPMLFKHPDQFTVETISEITDRFSECPDLRFFLFHTLHRPRIAAAARELAGVKIAELDRTRPDSVESRLAEQIAARLRTGPKKIVLVNLHRTYGDQLTGTERMVSSLLQYNPECEITVVSRKVLFYDHPRVHNLLYDANGFDLREVLVNSDMVMGITRSADERPQETLMLSIIQTYVDAHPELIYVHKREYFRLDRVRIAEEDYCAALAQQIHRIPRNIYDVYTTVLYAFGIPLVLHGESGTIESPLLGTNGRDEARSEIARLRSNGRKLGLLMPCGGMYMNKGFVPDSHPLANGMNTYSRLVPFIIRRVDEEYDVGIVPNKYTTTLEDMALLRNMLPEHMRGSVNISKSFEEYESPQAFAHLLYEADARWMVEGFMYHEAMALGVPTDMWSITCAEGGSGNPNGWLPDERLPTHRIITVHSESSERTHDRSLVQELNALSQDVTRMFEGEDYSRQSSIQNTNRFTPVLARHLEELEQTIRALSPQEQISVIDRVVPVLHFTGRPRADYRFHDARSIQNLRLKAYELTLRKRLLELSDRMPFDAYMKISAILPHTMRYDQGTRTPVRVVEFDSIAGEIVVAGLKHFKNDGTDEARLALDKCYEYLELPSEMACPGILPASRLRIVMEERWDPELQEQVAIAIENRESYWLGGSVLRLIATLPNFARTMGWKDLGNGVFSYPLNPSHRLRAAGLPFEYETVQAFGTTSLLHVCDMWARQRVPETRIGYQDTSAHDLHGHDVFFHAAGVAMIAKESWEKSIAPRAQLLEELRPLLFLDGGSASTRHPAARVYFKYLKQLSSHFDFGTSSMGYMAKRIDPNNVSGHRSILRDVGLLPDLELHDNGKSGQRVTLRRILTALVRFDGNEWTNAFSSTVTGHANEGKIREVLERYRAYHYVFDESDPHIDALIAQAERQLGVEPGYFDLPALSDQEIWDAYDARAEN